MGGAASALLSAVYTLCDLPHSVALPLWDGENHISPFSHYLYNTQYEEIFQGKTAKKSKFFYLFSAF
jgi:hypothetical protein